MAPLSAKLINGTGSLTERGVFVTHCLLVETRRGWLLVDCGIGQGDIDAPARFGVAFDLLAKPAFDPAETPTAQITALGIDPAEVTEIVLTHLDLDHAGGLSEFPAARVHVSASEHAEATQRPSLHAKLRYIPRQWAHQPNWRTYGGAGRRWYGFDGVSEVDGFDGDVLLVPLPGHTAGHCGVALRTDHGWLLHCGDAYMTRGQVDPYRPYCPTALSMFQTANQWSRRARLASLARLRRLAIEHPDEITLLCTHDAEEFALYTAD